MNNSQSAESWFPRNSAKGGNQMFSSLRQYFAPSSWADSWFGGAMANFQPPAKKEKSANNNIIDVGAADWNTTNIGPFNMSHVNLWDAASNSYQNVQVYQHEGPQPAPASTSPIKGGGSWSCNDIMDMASDMLVQYVCKETAPSPFRPAFETLAKSNLNPNAEEFVPRGYLDQMILREIHNSRDNKVENSISCDRKTMSTSEKVNPPESVPDLQISIQFSQVWSFCQSEALADFSNRKSEIRQKDKETVRLVSSNESKCALSTAPIEESTVPEISSPVVEESSLPEISSPVCESESNQKESALNNGFDSVADKRQTSDSINEGSSRTPSCAFSPCSLIRCRTPSTCTTSSDSGSSRNLSESSDDSLVKFQRLDEDEDADAWEEEDSDWDTVDDGDIGEIDLSALEEFCCPMDLSQLTSSQCVVPKQPKSEGALQASVEDDISCAEDDFSSDDADPCAETQLRLNEANRAWNVLEDKTRNPMRVYFSNEPVLVIHEPEDQAYDLQQARISDFNQRKADRERMEELLRPVLSAQHRQAVYSRLYADS